MSVVYSLMIMLAVNDVLNEIIIIIDKDVQKTLWIQYHVNILSIGLPWLSAYIGF